MKIQNFILILLISTLIIGCASTVKDKSAVENGNMALIKGLEMESLKQLLAPIGATKGIVIRQINSSEDDSDKLEVLLPQGQHSLSLLCSYQIGGGYIKSQAGKISLSVKAGNVYQLEADLTNIQTCNVTSKDLGKYSSVM
ncbi:hypothetical protein ACRTDJ_19810 [Shewanella algae]